MLQQIQGYYLFFKSFVTIGDDSAVTSPAVPVMASNASDVRIFMVVAFHGPDLVSAQIHKTKSPDASILGNILHRNFTSVQ